MREDILDQIFEGESETLELKVSIRDPRSLSNLIGSFANANGGKIIVGVKEPPEVVGVDERITRRVFESSMARLAPKPVANLLFIENEGKRIAVIDVQRSPDIVLSDGRAFVRTGTMTQPMAWTQMLQHLPTQPTQSTFESLTKAIERQSKLIEEMHRQIQAANTWQARWKERIIAFTFGVIASVIASVLYAKL